MRRIGLILTTLLMAGSTAAQTTRPAVPAANTATVEQQAWPKLVEAFTKALIESDERAVSSMLSPRAFSRRIEATTFEEQPRFMERVAKSAVVGQHAYVHPALAMAADIAADFKTAAGVPDKTKARFLIDDEVDMKRANATAVQWLVDQLDIKNGSHVGVIVLWTPRPPVPGVTPEGAPVCDPVFVLVRGEEIDPGEFRINYVVYGCPMPTTETASGN